LLTPGWRSKGKLSSRPTPRQTRLRETIGQAAFAARRGFLAEQAHQHLRGGDGLAFGAREFGIEHLGHAVQPQLVDQRAQLVTHRHSPRP
jgi:hypothetical protein